MKIFTALMGMLMLFLMVAAASAASNSTQTNSASGSTTLSADDAVSQVYVSSVTVNPQEFYPYEEGTITVQVTNSGSQAVAFEDADILDSNVYIEDEAHNPYRAMTYLGPGNTMTYTFKVVAKPPEGMYFPLFTLASRDAGSIRYPIMVKIDSKPIESSFSIVPDNFAVGSTDNVTLTINNPREGAITNVVITPQGSGFGITPDKIFLASVPAQSSVNVPFAITPYKEATVNFSIQYNNGLMNPHSDSISLPLVIGASKTAANPVINNLALTTPGSYYQLTGDVTNTGITDASGVTLSTGSPVQPAEPYAQYAVGSLTSNDFSSFTLTFTGQDLSAVPITVQWKDANGNSLSTVKTVDLRSLAYSSGTGSTRTGSSGSGSTGATGSALTAGSNGAANRGGGGMFGIGGGRAGGLSAFYPVIAGGIIVIVAIVLYLKRKWIFAKFKKQ
jgi:archaellum component FlaF (FlaF/FlaG flagellin family)